MTITVEATYEEGVLKPARPLPLAEHERVQVTVEAPAGAKATEAVSAAAPGEPVWERLAKLGAQIPEEELAKLPTDGASQLDHYLYGSPKRTDLTE